jgi:hypothetical protein
MFWDLLKRYGTIISITFCTVAVIVGSYYIYQYYKTTLKFKKTTMIPMLPESIQDENSYTKIPPLNWIDSHLEEDKNDGDAYDSAPAVNHNKKSIGDLESVCESFFDEDGFIEGLIQAPPKRDGVDTTDVTKNPSCEDTTDDKGVDVIEITEITEITECKNTIRVQSIDSMFDIGDVGIIKYSNIDADSGHSAIEDVTEISNEDNIDEGANINNDESIETIDNGANIDEGRETAVKNTNKDESNNDINPPKVDSGADDKNVHTKPHNTKGSAKNKKGNKTKRRL